MKTNEKAGDGTTTTVVLASKIVETCFERLAYDVLGAGADAMTMFREIHKAKEIVIEKLKEMSRPVKDFEELNQIISVSLENEEFAKVIAGMIETLGEKGYISVEDNFNTKYSIEPETITGMKFYGTYASPIMITNTKKEAVWTDTPVLVCNHEIENTGGLTSLLKELNANGKMKLVIVAERFDKQFIRSIAYSMKVAREGAIGPDGKQYEAMKILAVKAPSMTTEQLEDVAVYVKGAFINKSLGLEINKVKYQDLGFAKKIIVNEDDVIISGGNGEGDLVDERVKLIEEHLAMEKDPAFAERLKRRIGSLRSGVGIIRVGASTESERGYLKLKIEDAVNAAKAAMAEGVVAGGGLALSQIANELGKDNILYEVLKAPYQRIQDNAGGLLDIPDTVLDPVKVTRLAIENACSAASALITTDSAIAEKKETLWDMLDDKLYPKDDEDFRSDANQDVKFK
jgi:chaperonin GroEL